MSSDKLNLFVSYSNRDKAWLERVQVHLKPMARNGELELWDDTRIKAGDRWRPEIEAALSRADVAVLLISADFYASDFIARRELPPLLQAAQSEHGLVILGVHINYSHFGDDEILSEYQTVNKPDEPIEDLASRGQQEKVFRDLARRIRELASLRRSGGSGDAEAKTTDASDGNGFGWSINTPHGNLTAQLLGVEDARDFRRALRVELERQFGLETGPETPVSIVNWFSSSPKEPGDVRHLLLAVRRALRSLDRTTSRDQRARRAVGEAAAALYCLAACRYVDHATHRVGDYVLRVPHSKPIVYAVISTVLFGGELRLMEADHATLPQPEYIFEIALPAGGQRVEEDFERAVYIALFPDREETLELALDTGPLNSAQRGRLIARLETLKEVERASFALIVNGIPEGTTFDWPQSQGTPVMLPHDDIASALLRIDPGLLEARIEEFWAQLCAWRSEAREPVQAHRQPSPAEGAANMPRISINARDGATIAVSTGKESPPRAERRDGVDPEALGQVLRDLVRALEKNASPDVRSALAPHVDAVRDEANKDRPDPGRIRQALDAIDGTVKKSAGILEGGEKIASLLYRAYQHLPSFLGDPSGP